MDILSKGRNVSNAKVVETETVCLPKASHFSRKMELEGVGLGRVGAGVP